MTFHTVNRWLAAAALTLLSLTAWADSPVTGATLYSANCTGSGCHNTSTPLTSNAAKIYNARNAAMAATA